MSNTTISRRIVIDGALTDAESVVLANREGTYGVKRMDTGAVVVAAGTAMIRDGVGLYHYTFTDPAPWLIYNYWIKARVNGIDYYSEKDLSGPAAGSAGYVEMEEADAMAADLPGLIAYKAATGQQKAAALSSATSDIDAGMRYQGRKYEPDQSRQFPRIAYEIAGDRAGSAWPSSRVEAEIIWDWDDATRAAVVPRDVKLAAIYQADAILAGGREERLDRQHDGVTYDQTGGMAESYKQAAAGVMSGLCRRSYQLLAKYRLRGGRIL